MDPGYLPSRRLAETKAANFPPFVQKLMDHFSLSLQELSFHTFLNMVKNSYSVDLGLQPMKAELLELIFWGCAEL